MADDAIAIVGPTASGKSALAVAVAKRIDGEIISMDSRQVYRGMDIGTAKPGTAERDGIPHHGFDLITPDERYSAGRFARDAAGWIAGIRGRGRIPVIVGGTGFFLRALMTPLFNEPELDDARREQLKQYLGESSDEELARWAQALDSAQSSRVRDRQRRARIIEVALLTGRPLSWWHRQAPAAAAVITPRIFALDLPRDILVERIDSRVTAMVEAGLVDEVQALLDAGYSERDPGMSATGYIELVPCLRGERSLSEAVGMIRATTRQYARRQRTWLRNQLPAGACWLDGTQPVDTLADRLLELRTEASR